MKTKSILTVALITALGSCILWMAPHHSLAAETAPAGRKILNYTCAMHPSVKAARPGACPICGMALRPVYADNNGTNTPPATASTNRPAAKTPGCCSPGGCCR
jgi:hypothetical protein